MAPPAAILTTEVNQMVFLHTWIEAWPCDLGTCYIFILTYSATAELNQVAAA